MPYKNASIIFDLDGTLIDSAPDLLAATNHIMEFLGLSPIAMETLRPIVGKGARAMIATGCKSQGLELPEEKLESTFPVFLDYYRKNISVYSKPFEGVVDILETIKNSGGSLGVCTNKREDLAREVLSELELLDYFCAVVGSDTLDVRKPHPGHLLGTIAQMDGVPSRSVMIGDSAPDINAAKAANIPVVAVSFGYTDIPVQELQPDAVIDNYEQLPEILISFLHPPK